MTEQRSSQRNTRRLDYAELNSTGRKVEKPSVESPQRRLPELPQPQQPQLPELPRSQQPQLPELQQPQQSQQPQLPKIQQPRQQQEESSEESSDSDNEELSPADLLIRKLIMADQLISSANTLAEDIEDFLDEHKLEDLGGRVQDYDLANNKIEELRTQYRNVHYRLKTNLGEDPYNAQYETPYKATLVRIKEYIRSLVKARQGVIQTEDLSKKNTQEVKSEKFRYLKKQFLTVVGELEEVFIPKDDVRWRAESDDAISKRRDKFPHQQRQLDTLSRSLSNLLDAAPGKDSLTDIEQRYDDLIKLKSVYTKSLDSVVKAREIDEKKAFNKSKLKMKIPPFKGYDGIDIYTFQTTFEKVYLEDTPSHLLPDLLKNNYLENPALLLVKDVHDIDDIWKRLKSAYGDTKIMLSRKITELENLDELWKKKEPEKLGDGLIKLINLMRDLMTMAENHDIEVKLYHGDAINTIHSLMGQPRFRRWMSIVYDEEIPDGAKHWDRLLMFLEKDLNICQKEMILPAKAPKNQPVKPQGGKKKPDGGHHVEEEGNLLCSICGADDHVQTPGPSGIKLIQYYVCQKFVEMNCKERFITLKNKNLCHPYSFLAQRISQNHVRKQR